VLILILIQTVQVDNALRFLCVCFYSSVVVRFCFLYYCIFFRQKNLKFNVMHFMSSVAEAAIRVGNRSGGLHGPSAWHDMFSKNGRLRL
jgi:hypothetical protein